MSDEQVEVRRKGDVRGMTGVFTGTKWRRFFFWLLIAILALLTIRDVTLLALEYAENEKEADMNIVFNQSMSFPNFTFCVPMPMILSTFNSSRFKTKADIDGGKTKTEEVVKKSLAKFKTKKDFLGKPWDWRLVKESIKVIGTLHSMERETDDSFVAREIDQMNRKGTTIKTINVSPQLVRVYFQLWLNEIHKRKISFGQFMQKSGSEVLRRSVNPNVRNVFRMVTMSHRTSMLTDKTHNSQFKITWISEGDLCFQPVFDEDGAADIQTPGNFYGITFNHDPAAFSDGLHCIMVDMNGRRADMSRFIDSGGHTKDGVSEEICAGTTNNLIVEVRATYEMIENKQKGTACADFDENEDGDDFDCRSRCRMNLIRSICQCTPVTTLSLSEPEDLEAYPLCDYSKCKVDVQKAAKSEKDCTKDCRRNCKMIRYNINLVGSQESVSANKSSDDTKPAPHQTSAFIAWGSFEYFQLEQNFKYESFVNFLADIGGAIGIWLGLSILTLIQGAVYFAEVVTDKVTGKTHEEEDYEEDEGDRKVSQSPLGPVTMSANPFGDFDEPRKRSATNSTN